MGMNKKAFFFTVSAIALATVIIITNGIIIDRQTNDNRNALDTRIFSTDFFINHMEKDLENVIFIIGFRSLISIEDYMMKYDDFLNNLGSDFNSAFNEVFINGTINNEEMILMKNNTFKNWTKKMKFQANKSFIIINFSVNNITIEHATPWIIDISINLSIDLRDKKNISSWNIENVYTNNININGFVDPLYLVNNDGMVNNTIRKTTISDFGVGLSLHINKSYYVEHSDAPSYLMRFENNLGSSIFGIESLVNASKLLDEGLTPKTRSAVDYIYYGSQVTTDCNIQEINDPLFYLDSSHLVFYQATCV